MNPVEQASEHASQLSAEPLAWICIFMAVCGIACMVFLAKFILIPLRDELITGHKECQEKLTQVESFQRDTLVKMIEDYVKVTSDHTTAIRELSEELRARER